MENFTINFIKKRGVGLAWIALLLICFCNPKTMKAESENPTFALACKKDINLTLNAGMCTAVVDSSMLLSGTFPMSTYTVTLFYDLAMTQPVPTSPMVTGNEVGLTIYASVTNDMTGLSCWSNIYVEDKSVMPLECLPDTLTIPCDQDITPVWGGRFNVPPTPDLPIPLKVDIIATNIPQQFILQNFDPCGDATLSYTDVVIDGSICGEFNRVFERVWIVVDESGNSDTCTQIIQLMNMSDVFDPIENCPPNWFTEDPLSSNNNGALQCEDRFDPNNTATSGIQGWNVIPDGEPFAGNPSPYDIFYPGTTNIKWQGTGAPVVGGCAGVNVTFSDLRINGCDAGPSEGCFKVLRTWLVLDWCSNTIDTCTQIIKIEDNEAPTVDVPDSLTVSVDVWRCETDFIAPVPNLSDNCNSIPLTYTVQSSAGLVRQIPGDRFQILGLAPGQYDIIYATEDCCGNLGIDTLVLTVIDDVAPVAVCDRTTVVNLTTSNNPNDPSIGTSKVYATTFDDGSYDNCDKPLFFKVIRMDELDSDGDGIQEESVLNGDHQSIACDAANGDDDPRSGIYNGPQSYFDDYIKVCCEDITAGPVMVVFRVFDTDPEPFTVGKLYPGSIPLGEDPDDYNGVDPAAMAFGGPLYGHYSDCMVEVEVQDKIPPVVVAPQNITVTCDFWFPYDPANPSANTSALDSIFGKVVEGSIDPMDRDSIIVRDRVCIAHPRFADYAPASIFSDPCYDDLYDIYWGIDGYVIDNCDINLDQTVSDNLSCNQGTITRRWTATDGQGNLSNAALQRITIINCKEFYVPNACWRNTTKDVGSCDLVAVPGVGTTYRTKLIEWPCDIELSRCQGPTDQVFRPENLDIPNDQDRRPRFDDDKCSQIAATYTDKVFTFIDSSCIKIFREWHVIDWCRRERGLTPFEWEWEQVIKLQNTNGPTFAACEDVTVCGFGNPTLSDPNADQCVGQIILDPGITDDCTTAEDLRIDWKLDAFDDGEYDILGYSRNFGAVYPFPNSNNLPVVGFDAEDYATSASDYYPVGTHRILWGVEDGCGNMNSCEYLFTIEDCKPPTAYCEDGVSTIPMPIAAGGFIDIWANDFDLDSYDNCTSQANLRFAFSTDVSDRAIRRTCADVTGVEEVLTIYVFDSVGNYATCEVTLLLSDCMNQSSFNISGGIATEEAEMVSDVMVYLTGYETEQMATQNDGAFDFADLPEDNNYTVRPEKDINPLNGVSTYDLVTMSKHILEIEELNSPYKLIAADINKDGKITAFDMVELRKMILYINTEFPQNTSWRFVEAGYTFPNPADPFQNAFPEVYDVNSLNQNMLANFVAVKIGDVDDSVRPNRLAASEDRNAVGTLNFSVLDQQLETGQTYEIEFTSADLNEIEGYQFTLDVNNDALAIADISGNLENLTASNFGTRLIEKGALTTSWMNTGNVEIAADQTVFTLTVRAKRSVSLSEALAISSNYTNAEAYDKGESLYDVSLSFSTGEKEFVLMQNQPNPFRDETTIGFVLPESGEASLKIFDTTGKLLKATERVFEKGYNEVSINQQELQANGILYYTLESVHGSATKKMILIK